MSYLLESRIECHIFWQIRECCIAQSEIHRMQDIYIIAMTREIYSKKE